MKRIIRLTESDLTRIIRKVIKEENKKIRLNEDDEPELLKAGINQIYRPPIGADFIPYVVNNGATDTSGLAVTVTTTQNKTYDYICVPDPYFEAGMKTRKITNPLTKKTQTIETQPYKNGQLYDSNDKIIDPNYTTLEGNWKELLWNYCKPLSTWYYAEKQKIAGTQQQVAGTQTNTYQSPVMIKATKDPVLVTNQHISGGLIGKTPNPDGSYTVNSDFNYNNVPYKKGQKVKFIQ
jgi:hypothetical protein